MATLYEHGFNDINLKVLREMLKIKLAEIEQQTGVKLIVGKITYDTKSFKAGFEGIIPNESEQELNVVELKLKSNLSSPKCWQLFGLTENDYGKRKKIYGEWFTLIGVKDRNQKQPIIVERESDGSRCKISFKLWYESPEN
jgi:hypothetical protein